MQILKSLLRHVRHTLKSSDIMTVAGNAHGYVGADLAALVNEGKLGLTLFNNFCQSLGSLNPHADLWIKKI